MLRHVITNGRFYEHRKRVCTESWLRQKEKKIPWRTGDSNPRLYNCAWPFSPTLYPLSCPAPVIIVRNIRSHTRLFNPGHSFIFIFYNKNNNLKIIVALALWSCFHLWWGSSGPDGEVTLCRWRDVNAVRLIGHCQWSDGLDIASGQMDWTLPVVRWIGHCQWSDGVYITSGQLECTLQVVSWSVHCLLCGPSEQRQLQSDQV